MKKGSLENLKLTGHAEDNCDCGNRGITYIKKHVHMDGKSGYMMDSKKANIAITWKGWEVVESHDNPRLEGTHVDYNNKGCATIDCNGSCG